MATPQDTALRHAKNVKDPTKRRLPEDILANGQPHAEELQGWLTE